MYSANPRLLAGGRKERSAYTDDGNTLVIITSLKNNPREMSREASAAFHPRRVVLLDPKWGLRFRERDNKILGLDQYPRESAPVLVEDRGISAVAWCNGEVHVADPQRMLEKATGVAMAWWVDRETAYRYDMLVNHLIRPMVEAKCRYTFAPSRRSDRDYDLSPASMLPFDPPAMRKSLRKEQILRTLQFMFVDNLKGISRAASTASGLSNEPDLDPVALKAASALGKSPVLSFGQLFTAVVDGMAKSGTPVDILGVKSKFGGVIAKLGEAGVLKVAGDQSLRLTTSGRRWLDAIGYEIADGVLEARLRRLAEEMEPGLEAGKKKIFEVFGARKERILAQEAKYRPAVATGRSRADVDAGAETRLLPSRFERTSEMPRPAVTSLFVTSVRRTMAVLPPVARNDIEVSKHILAPVMASFLAKDWQISLPERHHVFSQEDMADYRDRMPRGFSRFLRDLPEGTVHYFTATDTGESDDAFALEGFACVRKGAALHWFMKAVPPATEAWKALEEASRGDAPAAGGSTSSSRRSMAVAGITSLDDFGHDGFVVTGGPIGDSWAAVDRLEANPIVERSNCGLAKLPEFAEALRLDLAAECFEQCLRIPAYFAARADVVKEDRWPVIEASLMQGVADGRIPQAQFDLAARARSVDEETYVVARLPALEPEYVPQGPTP